MGTFLFIFCLIFVCWGAACILAKFEDAIFGNESYVIGRLMALIGLVYLLGLLNGGVVDMSYEYDDILLTVMVALCLLSVGFFVFLAATNDEQQNKKALTPLSEIRCSDLERLYDECETSANVDRCRKRYDLKIAMCYGVR